ncbi:MAG TPA: hypothetical protein PLP29_05615 [Candidatus Ozemobacteraceae bacterium]|nr:hypothetical protein [Candidatus Ozemobacteraceae bacterium]
MEFDRLLREHPLMSQFDEETGRFKGTPSEVREAASIASEIASLDRDLASVERRRSEMAGALLLASDPLGADFSGWNEVREADAGIAELQKRRDALTGLMRIGGAPDADSLTPLVSGLVQDLLASCSRAPDTILLNRFPRFPAAPPVVEIRPPGEKDGPNDPIQPDLMRLREVIRSAPLLGPLFPSTERPILYSGEAPHP